MNRSKKSSIKHITKKDRVRITERLPVSPSESSSRPSESKGLPNHLENCSRSLNMPGNTKLKRDHSSATKEKGGKEGGKE